MAAQRKLQSEIDKTMKKIDEHIEEFETLWSKVQAAPTPALKDKYENDLKKEIKKLQRQRDQLKTWIASNEVKNKKPLLEGRRLIEQQMERFKILERETKTKAYSKEGLSRDQHRRRTSDDDNEEDELSEEVIETMEWLDTLRDELEEEQDKLTQHLDKLKQTASSSTKKNKINEEDLTSSQHMFDRHAWHIQQIDAIKDALENGSVEAVDVNNIKEDIEYYVHNHKEAEFEEDEMIYDVLDLPAYTADSDHGETSASDTESAVDAADDNVTATSTDPIAKIIGSSHPAKPHAVPPKSTANATPAAASKPQAIPAKQQSNAAQNNRAQAKSSPPSALNPLSSPARQVQSNAAKSGATATVQLQRRTSPPATTTPLMSTASSSAAATSSVPSTQSTAAPAGKGESLASILAKQQQQSTAGKPPAPAVQPAAATPTAILQKPQLVNGAQVQQPQPPQQQQPAATSQAKSIAVPPQQSPPASRQPPTVSVPSSAPSTASLPRTPSGSQRQASATPTHQQQQQPPPPATDIYSPPAQLQPLSNASSTADLPPEYMANLNLLSSSRQHLPDPSDTERAKVYIPRNPFSETFGAPPSFPTTPSPIFEQSNLWEKFSADTLFFIFYFQQGTSHQYLAARELKRASWRYHKNFLTWFQRHDDVVVTTEEYEQGTYVYFDYESGWCQRIKHDFTFEYKHLEDDLTLPSV